MPHRVQALGAFEQQFQNIIDTALDKNAFIDVLTPGADVEFALDHGLGIEPLGFLVIMADKATNIYMSATPRTSSMIYLKSSTAAVSARIIIF